MKDQVNRNLDFLVVPVKCEISFVSDHFGAGVYNKKTNKPDTKGKKYPRVRAHRSRVG